MKKPCPPKGHGFFIVPSNELVHQEESLSDGSYNVQELSQMALLPVRHSTIQGCCVPASVACAVLLSFSPNAKAPCFRKVKQSAPEKRVQEISTLSACQKSLQVQQP